MNVRAKHNGGSVHLGGHEYTNGRWSPACGMQSHNTGLRAPSPLYPTDAEVTCKRCLKLIAKQTQERAIEQRRAEARASIAATRRKMHSTVQNALRQEDPLHKRIQDSIGLYW